MQRARTAKLWIYIFNYTCQQFLTECELMQRAHTARKSGWINRAKKKTNQTNFIHTLSLSLCLYFASVSTLFRWIVICIVWQTIFCKAFICGDDTNSQNVKTKVKITVVLLSRTYKLTHVYTIHILHPYYIIHQNFDAQFMLLIRSQANKQYAHLFSTSPHRDRVSMHFNATLRTNSCSNELLKILLRSLTCTFFFLNLCRSDLVVIIFFFFFWWI